MIDVVDSKSARKLSLAEGQAAVQAEAKTEKVLGPKAVDELREILRKDEDVREFFLLLKNRELRAQAIDAINQHLSVKRG